MEIILGIATFLGGLTAVWFLWDKFKKTKPPEEEYIAMPSFKTKEKLLDKDIGTKFIEEKLRNIVSQLPKVQKELNSIIFTNVDDLTKINKKHGENGCNIVLTIIANILFSRENPICRGRRGDDTFYTVLFKADKHKTWNLFEKIKKPIETFSWKNIAHGHYVTSTIDYSILNPRESPYDWIISSLHGMLGRKNGGDNISSIRRTRFCWRQKCGKKKRLFTSIFLFLKPF